MKRTYSRRVHLLQMRKDWWGQQVPSKGPAKIQNSIPYSRTLGQYAICHRCDKVLIPRDENEFIEDGKYVSDKKFVKIVAASIEAHMLKEHKLRVTAKREMSGIFTIYEQP